MVPSVLFVLVCFCLFCLSHLSPPGGHDLDANPSCPDVLPQARGISSSPLWSSLAIRNIFRGICFPHYLLFPYSIFLTFFHLSFSFFLSFDVSGLLTCVYCACRIPFTAFYDVRAVVSVVVL